MEYCAVQLTSNDYKEYRRAYSKMVFSIFDKNAMMYHIEEQVSKLAVEKSMRTRSVFIKDIESSDRTMHFFKRGEETIGFFELSFHKGKCDIVEMFVFERYKGYGTRMMEEVEKVARERNASRIELWAPYVGAQIFWTKMGFKEVKINGVKCHRKVLK